MEARMKPLIFVGTTLTDMRDFPEDVRREAGYQLDRVQNGLDPKDWKPMASVGVGVREVRVRGASGAYRILYVTRVGDNIYVLHAFAKKTQRTSLSDIQIGRARYKAIVS
jgi:phage-related protein